MRRARWSNARSAISYNKDIDEILVAGDDAYRDARDFMRMLMPSHAKNVKPYQRQRADVRPVRDRKPARRHVPAGGAAALRRLHRDQSGGGRLVAIDVNSGRATREHHIEDTALKTNVEAAEEIARQLRLRDLRRADRHRLHRHGREAQQSHRRAPVEGKPSSTTARASRSGHISHFVLLEMSRQRIRSSVLESSTEKCPHCGGTGHVRSVLLGLLAALRAIEEMLLKGATHNLIVRTRSETALYLLNHKRAHLRDLEERFQLTITVNADAAVAGQVSYLIEKGEQVHSIEQAKALVAVQPTSVAPLVEDDYDEATEELERSRRPRERRGGRRGQRGRRGGSRSRWRTRGRGSAGRWRAQRTQAPAPAARATRRRGPRRRGGRTGERRRAHRGAKRGAEPR